MIDAMQFPQRIHDVAQRDPQRRLFGCQLHKYESCRCLAESEVVALESTYGIEVPSEYRVFLTRVGNGGAGPGNGLVALKGPVAPKQSSNRKMGATVRHEVGRVIRKAHYEDVGVNYDAWCHW